MYYHIKTLTHFHETRYKYNVNRDFCFSCSFVALMTSSAAIVQETQAGMATAPEILNSNMPSELN
jgi:hypothetical protein